MYRKQNQHFTQVMFSLHSSEIQKHLVRQGDQIKGEEKEKKKYKARFSNKTLKSLNIPFFASFPTFVFRY